MCVLRILSWWACVFVSCLVRRGSQAHRVRDLFREYRSGSGPLSFVNFWALFIIPVLGKDLRDL